MPAQVRFRVVAGPTAGQEFVFAQRTTTIAGRADDCVPQIPESGTHAKLASRHHCLFDINPPDVRVRDLGSLNGTFVNGVQIGRRHVGQSPEQGSILELREKDLHDGDTVRIGDTLILVEVSALPHSAPAPADPAFGGPVRSAPAQAAQKAVCSVCGKDAGDLTGARHGKIICEECRADPPSRVFELLSKAQAGAESLFAIRGYQPVRELGRGGQGVVYLARHEGTGEEVALKVLLAQVAVEKAAVYGFQREVASVAALRHPNVVRFRGSGADGGTFYFTSEYCAGGNVLDLMRRLGRTLTAEEAVPIAAQVLDGLAYAHSAPIPGRAPLEGAGAPVGLGIPARGLVHRDVKPPNILLTAPRPGAEAKLGDFGLAKAFDLAGLSGHTMTGSIGGTLSYMPRVQVLNYRFVKPEVDVWACAASLYFMLTGSTPRTFPKGQDSVNVVLKTAAVPIRERDSLIPPRLAAVIDEALVDKPRIMVTSAAQLAAALRAAL